MKNTLIIGIGLGAQNVLNRKKDNIEYAKLLAISPDELILKQAKVPTLLFPNREGGEESLGCGGDTKLGEEIAEENCELLKKELNGIEHVIIISCLGGGFGSGATPVIAEYLKSLGADVNIIVTLPFLFEGKKRQTTAVECAEKLRKISENTIVLSNDNLLNGLNQKCSAQKAFSIIDDKIISRIKTVDIKEDNEITFSLVNNELSLQQELEIKKMSDALKHSTIKSISLKFKVNKDFVLSNMAEIVNSITALFSDDTKIELSTEVDETIQANVSYLTLNLITKDELC